MAHAREPVTDGPSRPGATSAQKASSTRDAVAPEARTLPEHAELSNSPEGRRIEQKLRAEAAARRTDDDAALDDPTGHA